MAALLGQVAQLNQALVQLADALARVAALQGDVGAADGRVGGEQLAQGGHGGLTGHAQAAFLLEQLHGVLRAAAKLAVGRVGQVAQLAQAVLQILHANAGVAAGFLDVLDVLGRVGGVQLLLDRRAGNAVLAQAGLILEVEQGDASLFAEYAVRLAAGEAQLVEAILELRDRFAAGTVLQGWVGVGGGSGHGGCRGGRGRGGHDGHSGHGLGGRIDRRQLDHLENLGKAVVGAQAVHQHVVARQAQVKLSDRGGIVGQSHLAVVAALGDHAGGLVDQAQHAGIRQHRNDIAVGDHALDHRRHDSQRGNLHGVHVVGIHRGLAGGLVVHAVVQVAAIGRLAVGQLVAQQAPGLAGLGTQLQAAAVLLLGLERAEQVILGLGIERAGNQRAGRRVEDAVDVQARGDFALHVQALERVAQGRVREGQGRHVARGDVELIGRDLNRLEQAGVRRIQEVDLRVLLNVHRLAVHLIGNQGGL